MCSFKQVDGFPGLGFQGKNLRVMCVCAIVSFMFLLRIYLQ
jgi:hypothetical protein